MGISVKIERIKTDGDSVVETLEDVERFKHIPATATLMLWYDDGETDTEPLGEILSVDS